MNLDRLHFSSLFALSLSLFWIFPLLWFSLEAKLFTHTHGRSYSRTTVEMAINNNCENSIIKKWLFFYVHTPVVCIVEMKHRAIEKTNLDVVFNPSRTKKIINQKKSCRENPKLKRQRRMKSTKKCIAEKWKIKSEENVTCYLDGKKIANESII